MWIRVTALQSAAGLNESHRIDSVDSSGTYNASQLNTSAGGAIYTLLHHTATPSASPPPPPSSVAATAAAVTTARIYLSDIGLISDYSRHWNATGELSVLL